MIQVLIADSYDSVVKGLRRNVEQFNFASLIERKINLILRFRA